jgi:hypothetical protein
MKHGFGGFGDAGVDRLSCCWMGCGGASCCWRDWGGKVNLGGKNYGLASLEIGVRWERFFSSIPFGSQGRPRASRPFLSELEGDSAPYVDPLDSPDSPQLLAARPDASYWVR